MDFQQKPLKGYTMRHWDKDGNLIHEERVDFRPGLIIDSEGNVIGEKSMSDREFLAPLLEGK